MKCARIILLTIAMAGMTLVAVNRDAGAMQQESSPFQVLVVDAQRKDVPEIAVEVIAPDQSRHSYKTRRDGIVLIPGDVAVDGAVVYALRGKEAMGWIQLGDPTQVTKDGQRTWMMLLPLTHRVEGSVVNREGKPVAGARIGVEMLSHPNGELKTHTTEEPGGGRIGVEMLFLSTNQTLNQDLRSKDPLLGFVVTDDAGKFTLTLPQNTRARLRALHARSISPAIEVGANARTLSPATLEPTGGMVGRLTDAATGKPVVGAAVAAQLIEKHQRHLTDGWGQAVTNERGGYSIVGLEPGVYNVFLLEIPGRDQAAAPSVQAVRVRASEDATADLAAIEGKPLRGIVIDRETNRPIAAAQVGCQGPALPRSGTAIMGAKTDEHGRFTFPVPPGEQFVYLIDDPSSRWMSRRLVVVPDQGEVMPIYLLRPRGADRFLTPAAQPVPAPAPVPGGLTTITGTTVLRKATAPIVKLRMVTGRVRDPEGRPLAGIRVGVDPGPNPPTPGVDPDPFDTAVTDRDGTFMLGGLLRRKVSLILGRLRYVSQIESIPADRDQVEVTFQLKRDVKVWYSAAQVEDEPIPPAASRAIDVRQPHTLREQLPGRWPRRPQRRQSPRSSAARRAQTGQRLLPDR